MKTKFQCRVTFRLAGAKNQQHRHFGFICAGIFSLIALWPTLNGFFPAWTWLAAAVLMLLIAMLAPSFLAPFAKVWLTLGHILGIINTGLLLAMVFFLIVTPIGLLARLFGHDPLKLRRPGAAGYWQDRDEAWHADSFKNQF